MDDDNVFRFGAVKGGKSEEPEFPVNHYVVVDKEDVEWPATGFLVFTTHHVAIMTSTKDGAIPVLLVPLANVKATYLDDEEDFQERFDL